MRSRNAAKALVLALLAGALALPTAASADVSVEEIVALGDSVFLRTHQREIRGVFDPDRPARLLGRVRSGTSPFASDGDNAAWASTTGLQRQDRVRLYQLQAGHAGLIEARPKESSDLPRRLRIGGVAGADADHVYLRGGLRYDRMADRLERGHLPVAPDLEVRQTLAAPGAFHYLARAAGGTVVLLRHAPGEGWVQRPLADAGPAARLARHGDDLFLETGVTILRLDPTDLRVVEDLTPMLPEGRLRWFSADATSYWLGVPASGEGLELWRIDREILDGAPVPLASVPRGFVPLADEEDAIWFASVNHRRDEPLLSVSKIDGATRRYELDGIHGRRLRRGAEAVAIAAVVAPLAIVSAPAWIPLVLFAD